MKICWDNIEGIKLTKNGTFKKGSATYIYKNSCERCGEPYLTQSHIQSKHCGKSCALSGRIFSNKTKEKMSKSACQKKLSEEHKKRIGNAVRGEKNGFYGKKHTLGTRIKISKALEGKNFGSNNHFYGKKHSRETKKKIGEANKRYIRTKEYRLKMSIATSGEKNGNWKGGISCNHYCDVWLDKRYKQSIRKRDKYKCLNPDCTKQHTKLHLHHINYNKKDCRPKNLITICSSCNSRANFDREWHTAWYKAIINKRYGGK